MTGRTVAAVLALMLSASACDDAVPDIDTAPALAALASLDRDLTTCPIDDVDVLIEQSFDLVIDDASLDALERGEPYAFVQDFGDGRALICGRGADPSLSIGLVVGPGYTDIDAHVGDLTEPDAETVVDVVERLDYRGGEVSRVCVTSPAEPALDVCEVVWSDGEAFVAAFAGSSDAAGVDLRAVEERFLAVIQLTLDGLADA